MTSNNTYDIDYKKLVRWLTPNRLRKTRMLAWLGVLVSPVSFLYLDFLNFRKAKLYELGITPQVADLERLLNDRYDFVQRRIYIADTIIQQALYLYTDAEANDIDLFMDAENNPVILFTDSESGGGAGDDFVVMVPADLVFDNAEMRSVVTKFKLPGMKFKIQIF